MRIYYIARSNIPSRTANSIHVMKMCQGYADLGHRVTLLAPDWGSAKESGVTDVHGFYGVRPNFTVRLVPIPRWGKAQSVYFGLVLPLLAAAGRPSLVHSRSITAAWGAARLLRLPTVYETHDIPRPPAMFRQVAASSRLRGLVVVTHALAEHLRPSLPPGCNVIVAPDGVDAGALQPVMADAVRARLGLGDERRRLAVYTGHLYRGRGIELIVRLAAEMRDHLFLVVGGIETDIAHYRGLAAGIGNIRFVGFKPPAEARLYQQAADVLLMPYENSVGTSGKTADTAPYASPLKMFEYMATGRPIVASTLPVLREVLTDKVNALLLPYDEPRQWCDALARLRDEPEWAVLLAQRARQDVQQNTWQRRAERVLAAALGPPANDS